MRSQPNRNYQSNDDICTSWPLAQAIVEHFTPSGRCLEPCRGDGAFWHCLPNVDWCEIKRGRDFLALPLSDLKNSAFKSQLSGLPKWPLSRVTLRVTPERGEPWSLDIGPSLSGHARYDWIITNPPWSQIKPFLHHSLALAHNVVFLMTINHLWTKARLRLVEDAGFSLKEILLLDTPPSFPQSGFQLGAVHLAQSWRGRARLSRL